MPPQVSALTHIGRVKVMRYRPDKGDLLLEAGVGWKLGVIGRATLVSITPPRAVAPSKTAWR